jgi:hypothetical protein
MYIKFIWIALASFILTTNAYAYIDPGTGTIIIQAIVGALAAGAVTIKIYWYKLKAFFTKKKDKDLNK